MNRTCKKFLDDPALWTALRNDFDSLSQGHAFKCLYEKYYRSIEIYICGNQGETQDAQDTFQEILMVLCMYCRKPDFKPYVKVKTFIDAIGRRMWLHKLRGRKLEEVYTDLNYMQIDENGDVAVNAFIDLPDTVSDAEEREKIWIAIERALEKMEEKCRQIIQLTYWEGLRDDALAAVINTAVGSVKVLRFRCMSRLRNLLGAENNFINDL